MSEWGDCEEDENKALETVYEEDAGWSHNGLSVLRVAPLRMPIVEPFLLLQECRGSCALVHAPRISTPCYQLPPIPHPAFDIPIKLSNLLAPSHSVKHTREKILSSGCSKQQTTAEEVHAIQKLSLFSSICFGIQIMARLAHAWSCLGIALLDVNCQGNCSSLQKVQSMPCCHALVQGHADAEERHCRGGARHLRHAGFLGHVECLPVLASLGDAREMCRRFKQTLIISCQYDKF